MSNPSGIKVSNKVTEAWADACKAGADNVRALVLQITGDSFDLKDTVAPVKSFKEDVALLPKDDKTCYTYVYRTDDKKGANGWNWLLITFVPDHAGVRSKMLHASSKSGLLKSLGEGHFRENVFLTSVDDLTPAGLSSYFAQKDGPAPMSANEEALAQIKISEAQEASARVARLFGGDGDHSKDGTPTSAGVGVWSSKLDPSRDANAGKGVPLGVAKGNLKWGPGVEEALRKLKNGHKTGLGVFLHIEPKSETVMLNDPAGEQPCVLAPSQLSKKLPPREPCYTFYSWPNPEAAADVSSKEEPKAQQASETEAVNKDASESDKLPTDDAQDIKGSSSDEKESPQQESTPKVIVSDPESLPNSKVVFIYTCPSASPVRHRMIYSSSLRGLIRDAQHLVGLTIDKKLESSDIEDMTEQHIKDELFAHAQKSHSMDAYSGLSDKKPPVRKPVRSATAISQSQSPSASPSVSASSASQLPSPSEPERSSSGELPESAFSMFGPRIKVGSPGGGSFARPRPAGRR